MTMISPTPWHHCISGAFTVFSKPQTILRFQSLTVFSKPYNTSGVDGAFRTLPSSANQTIRLVWMVRSEPYRLQQTKQYIGCGWCVQNLTVFSKPYNTSGVDGAFRTLPSSANQTIRLVWMVRSEPYRLQQTKQYIGCGWCVQNLTVFSKPYNTSGVDGAFRTLPSSANQTIRLVWMVRSKPYRLQKTKQYIGS